MQDDLQRSSVGPESSPTGPAARGTDDPRDDVRRDSDAGVGSAGGTHDEPASTDGAPERGAAEAATDDTRPTWRMRAENLESDGLMHLERGAYKEAGDLLAKALSLYEDNDDEDRTLAVAQYMGVALHELGRVSDAVAIWEEMMTRGWSGPTIFGLLLRHYEQQERPDKIERLHARLRHSVAATDNIEYAPTTRPAGPRPPRETPRILVADNDEEVREILVRLLRREGYEVDAVADGEEALQEVLRDPPDVIVLDVYMPKRSGLDVLYQLRARGMTTRALVISGIADDSMVRDAVVLGARFLGKPLNMDELRSTLENILGDASPDRPEPESA